MKLILILKEICYKLNLVADYVVEQGTSGIWTYRKWNSGIAECWFQSASWTGVATTAVMGGYWTYASVTLPFNFVSAPAGVADAVTGTGMGFANLVGYSTSTITIHVVGNQNSKQINVRFAYVIGRWK